MKKFILLMTAISLVMSACGKREMPAPAELETTSIEATTEAIARSTVLFTTQADAPAQARTMAELPTGVVRPGDTPSPRRVNEKYRVATDGSDLRMRGGPSPDYPVAGTIPRDTVVTVSYIYNRWGYVNYKGTTGWCFMEYMDEDWYDYDYDEYDYYDDYDYVIRVRN